MLFSIIPLFLILATFIPSAVANQTSLNEAAEFLPDLAVHQDLGPRCPSACFRRRELAERSCALGGSRGCSVRRCRRSRGPIRNGRRFRGFRCTRRRRPDSGGGARPPVVPPPPVVPAPPVVPVPPRTCTNICRIFENVAQTDCTPFTASGACTVLRCLLDNGAIGFVCTQPIPGFGTGPPPVVTLPPSTTAAVVTAPVTLAPVTLAPVTLAPVTLAPVTLAPVTLAPAPAPGTNPPVSIPPVTNPGPPIVPPAPTCMVSTTGTMITCSCTDTMDAGTSPAFDGGFEDCFFNCLVAEVGENCAPPAMGIQGVIDGAAAGCCTGCPNGVFNNGMCMTDPVTCEATIEGTDATCACTTGDPTMGTIPTATGDGAQCFNNCIMAAVMTECEAGPAVPDVIAIIDGAAADCCTNCPTGVFNNGMCLTDGCEITGPPEDRVITCTCAGDTAMSDVTESDDAVRDCFEECLANRIVCEPGLPANFNGLIQGNNMECCDDMCPGNFAMGMGGMCNQ